MNDTLPHLLSVALVFVLGGLVKGVTGMGLPVVAMGLLGLFMPPAQAAAFLIFPSLMTNVWQFLAGPNRLALWRRFRLMLVAIVLSAWGATGLIATKSATLTTGALGAALAVYAVLGLFNIRFSVNPRHERLLSPVIGAASGVMAGATGVFAIPAVPYLQALGLEKEDLVQALGLAFTVSTFALAGGLATLGVFHLRSAGASLACMVPALLGMLIGQAIRTRVSPLVFRRLFFSGLLLLGADLVGRALVSG
jgi:uncharacterized membrane protein YfcA